jgi:hypothetical protein
MTTTTSKDIIPPARYQEASIRFREAWLEYIDKETLVKFEIVNMVSILESNGYSRTHAIEKIVDHNDLKGFSRRTIYRELPDNMKQSNSLRDLKQYGKQEQDSEVTYKDLDVSNDTNESINMTMGYDVKNAETVNDVFDNINDVESEHIENLEDSNNYNPQEITQIQQQKSNDIPNYMLPWYEHKTPYEKLEKDLPSEKINHLIEYHLGVIIDNYRQLWIEINRMIRKLHKENPNWKLSRIIYSIYESNEGTENYIPFNPKEIKKHLDTENKELFRIFKKDKPIQDMKSIEDMR